MNEFLVLGHFCLFQHDGLATNCAPVYYFGCCGSAFCVRVATDDHVSQSIIMLTEGVLAQTEMEKRRSPLVFRPFGAGIFKAFGSINPMD